MGTTQRTKREATPVTQNGSADAGARLQGVTDQGALGVEAVGVA
jgi:hypothetical protein